MRFKGHPLHMIMVHFPSALFPLSSLGNVWTWLSGDMRFVDFSFYCLTIGVVSGWLAAVPGALDLVGLQDKPRAAEAMEKGLIHAGLQIIVLLSYSVLAYLQYLQFPHLQTLAGWVVIVQSVLLLLMIMGNFIGAEIVLKMWHKINKDV